MLTKIDELKDRIEARKLLINAKLVELRADARHEAAGIRDKLSASLSELETTLHDGWDNVNDSVRAKLDAWLARD